MQDSFRGYPHLESREVAADIRRRRAQDSLFERRLVDAMAVDQVNVDRWLEGSQSRNDYGKAIAARALVGRPGIAFAPTEVRPVISLSYGVISVVQSIRFAEGSDRKKVRREGPGVVLYFDGAPMLDQGAACAMTILQAGVLFVLCKHIGRLAPGVVTRNSAKRRRLFGGGDQ